MTAVFWLVTIVLIVLAYAFVASPLLKKQRRGVITIVAIGLPVLTVGLYLLLGSPALQHAGPTSLSPASNTQPIANRKTASVASLIDGLAERLENNPDDGKGWLLLAKSYHQLGRSQEAFATYETAAALGQGDRVFEALLRSADAGANSPAQIHGNVSLAGAAKDIVLPGDTVFIFARAVDGPRMPVAVLQRPASDLPIDFMLNDNQSMTEDVKLSMFDRVIVTARISRSGIATEALRGLEASSDEITVDDNQTLNLIIATRKR